MRIASDWPHCERASQKRLGLRELCQQFADEQWVAVRMTPEQAAESVLEAFKPAVRQELELLEVRCLELGEESPDSGDMTISPALVLVLAARVSPVANTDARLQKRTQRK